MRRVCAIEDKTAVIVVVLYRSVSRNPVRFKALDTSLLRGSVDFRGFFPCHPRTDNLCNIIYDIKTHCSCNVLTSQVIYM